MPSGTKWKAGWIVELSLLWVSSNQTATDIMPFFRSDIVFCLSFCLAVQINVVTSQMQCRSNDDNTLQNLSHRNEDAENVEIEVISENCEVSENFFTKPPMLQKGVLRTNCIDCLDRTNVAQYAYGLVALGLQLQTLGLIKAPNIGLDSHLAKELMGVYETMGDTLALQYGGSAAHNKVILIHFGKFFGFGYLDKVLTNFIFLTDIL